jgi:formylglycine-generating enzyme required for sulfatase activity
MAQMMAHMRDIWAAPMPWLIGLSLLLLAGAPATALGAAQEAGTAFRDCADCPEMVVIPPGDFTMGRDAGRESETPASPVRVEAPFAIARTEVTLADYAQCVHAGPCIAPVGLDAPWDAPWDAPSDAPSDAPWLEEVLSEPDAAQARLPLSGVSRQDFQIYLAWLTGKTGYLYRLPTEAEWEYAASGGVPGPHWWGAGSIPPGQLNCLDCPDDGWPAAAPVASYPPNPFGLHDMLGNAAEVVMDCWRDSHEGRPETDAFYWPCKTYLQVVRGGAWSAPHTTADRYFRQSVPKEEARADIGFRIARTLNPE